MSLKMTTRIVQVPSGSTKMAKSPLWVDLDLIGVKIETTTKMIAVPRSAPRESLQPHILRKHPESAEISQIYSSMTKTRKIFSLCRSQPWTETI